MAGGDPSDDLDQLLDSALDDFNKLDLSSRSTSSQPSSSRAKKVSSGMNNSPSGPTGLGMGLPDPRAKRKGKQRAPQPMPRGSVNYASEALEKLTQQTRDAVRGLETVTAAGGGASVGPRGGEMGLNEEAMVEEFVKQFEDLAGSQDMESIVETMMQQLLSKEILHEPMKEIAQKYPKWLEEHKESLSKDDYHRYTRQYQFIVRLNEVYENDSENFTKIVELMQKMQECGQPPNDIVQEVAPDLDLASLGQLSPEMLEGAPNCCIM
ncbi:peroxisome biogenesis protein 19-2-like protein [Carex littledalei]|uniref:Peroxisome biogenesis protein 19-2-like protein n=1 Tax=Carex littledalei TaxID=544730 RepID=A0A833VXU2_9POAL|nr:peroxisome biogenesis protein 19-2-like protein [Carex littledalei]